MKIRPHVLVMSDYYLPGFKAGGPIRTLANIVEHLGEEFSFSVLTRDRDLGDSKPYSGTAREYVHVGKATVLYLPPADLAISGIRRRMLEVIPDIIYLNSFFSKPFSIVPSILLKFGQIPKVPVIMAPRGEFSPNALKIKSLKKRFYLTFAKHFGLYNAFFWQASGEHEASDIDREFPDSKIIVAPDLPPLVPKTCFPEKQAKTRGCLNLVFLSRISPMKNLHGALKILQSIDEGEIKFDIWGPIGDKSYWQECEKLFQKLPSNITVAYRGEVLPELVHKVLCSYDVFFLPTLGENFGHVILEALVVGLPVVISDRTQWRNLACRCAGWDIPLGDIVGFSNVLQNCINMDAQELELWADGAKRYASAFCDSDMLKEKTASLFLKCLDLKKEK